MQAIRRSPFVRCVVIPLTLIAFLAGCHKWTTPKGFSPESVIVEKEPERARITLLDGTQRDIVRPVIADDSLLACDRSGDKTCNRVALADVSRVEVRTTDALRTAALVAGLVLAAGAAAVSIGMSTWEGDILGPLLGSSD